jgi:acyl-[acyl-carrier-protein]-phospholipid O-acyltransferase/long-chain-fatty-acid--[acyl-carrier-protein] ligase
VPCDRKGEKLVVLFTEDLGDLNTTIERLKEADIPNLWKPHPSSFFKVDSIPLLGSGKLDLKGIRSEAEALASQGSA